MAEFEFTAEESEANERIDLYNGGSYDAQTNRYGFADGGYNFNQMEQARDVAIVGRFVRRIARYVAGLVAEAKAEREQTGRDRIATASDLKATNLDRAATAENVRLAAGQVDRARDEADRAERTASSVDGPAIAASIAQARRHAYALQLHIGS